MTSVVALALTGTAQAVTLINPDGSPVGGQWQQWADASRVPTIAGNLVFSTDATVCMGNPACSIESPYPISYGTPGTLARYGLYFELGHQFDWRYLTAENRRHLAWAWRQHAWHWNDSIASLELGGEDGLEGLFSVVYADCASGIDDKSVTLTPFSPTGVNAPSIYPRVNSCLYIDRIARRANADMESTVSAPWNRSNGVWYSGR